MRDHRFRTDCSRLSFASCRALLDEFSTQRIHISGNESAGSITPMKESQSTRVVHQVFASDRRFLKRSARHLRSPGSLRMPPVNPFQHVAELRS
jgi:hypothetical protein